MKVLIEVSAEDIANRGSPLVGCMVANALRRQGYPKAVVGLTLCWLEDDWQSGKKTDLPDFVSEKIDQWCVEKTRPTLQLRA